MPLRGTGQLRAKWSSLPQLYICQIREQGTVDVDLLAASVVIVLFVTSGLVVTTTAISILEVFSWVDVLIIKGRYAPVSANAEVRIVWSRRLCGLKPRNMIEATTASINKHTGISISLPSSRSIVCTPAAHVVRLLAPVSVEGGKLQREDVS
jgi:hypothetical protein